MRLWCVLAACLSISLACEADKRNLPEVSHKGTLRSITSKSVSFFSEGKLHSRAISSWAQVRVGPSVAGVEALKPGREFVFYSYDDRGDVYRIVEPNTDWAVQRFSIDACRVVEASTRRLTARDADALDAELDETIGVINAFKVWRKGKALALPFRQGKADSTRFFRIRAFWGKAYAVCDEASWQRCLADLRRRKLPAPEPWMRPHRRSMSRVLFRTVEVVSRFGSDGAAALRIQVACGRAWRFAMTSCPRSAVRGQVLRLQSEC